MDSFEINPENINSRRDTDPSKLRSDSTSQRPKPKVRIDYSDGFRTPRPDEPVVSERNPRFDNPLDYPEVIRPLNTDPLNPEPQYEPQQQQQQEQRQYQNVESAASTNTTKQTQSVPVQSTAQSPEQKHPNVATLARFFADGRLRIFFGVVMIIFAALMLVASISFLSHGPADQSIVLNSSPSEIAAAPDDVENTAGWFGAFLSNLLMYRWLGLGGFIIIFYFCALGISLVRLHHFRFWQLTFKSLVAAIAVSIIAGFATYTLVSPTFWGGEHGYWVNHGVISAASFWGGAGLSIVMLTALVLIFINPIRRGLSFLKMLIANRRNALAERYRSSMEAARAAVRHEQQTKNETVDNTDNTVEPDESEIINPVEPQPQPDYQPAPEPERHSPRPISVSVTNPEDNSTVENIINPIESQPQAENILNPMPDVEPEPSVTNTTTPEPERPTVAFTLSEIDTKPAQSQPTLNDRFTSRFETSETKEDEEEIVTTVTAAPPIEVSTEPHTPTAEEVLNSDKYDPRADLSRYRFPEIALLNERESKYTLTAEEQEENNQRIISTLDAYGIKIESIKATVGPTITLYEIIPQTGTRISSIKRLGDDMALSLSAIGIRIIAPIPGKGTIGMEVPNKFPQIVGIRSIFSSKAFNESEAALPIALGSTIDNQVYVADLAKMPHLLVAGATGMGKSVGLNTIIASLLYKKHPAELKFVLIDPKMVEFSLYKCLERHFLAKLPDEEEPIITDPQKVVATLNSLCLEMDNRYALLSKAGMRGIKEYNEKFISRRLSPEKGHRYLPYIVVIIDEFGDLILTAGKEVENPISRIAAKARAVGIHMIIATQRPGVDVITGVIKANFPGRMAFRVTQMNDSRIILDRPGAEQLIGRGDMLISRDGVIDRVQCAFIDTDEVEAICDYISDQMGYPTSYELPEEPAPQGDGIIRGALTDRDPMFADAGRAVIEAGMGSASLLQRKFNIGYPRAGKLIDQLEAAGVVGATTGAGKPRPVLLDSYSFERMLEG